MLLRRQAGARYSQSPIEADGGAVIKQSCRNATQVAGQYCSVTEISLGEGGSGPSPWGENWGHSCKRREFAEPRRSECNRPHLVRRSCSLLLIVLIFESECPNEEVDHPNALSGTTSDRIEGTT